MSIHDYAIILAGGEGTRFVPLSTPLKPKQFLAIIDPNRSMLQQTFERLANLVPSERVLVATNTRYRSLVSQQLPQLPGNHIIGEPIKKNTAPTMAFLTHVVHARDPQAVLIFLPSDHYIHQPREALECLGRAMTLADKMEVLVTLGIPPSFPSTDYGYIKSGEAGPGTGAWRVLQFVEKPNEVVAQDYVKSGLYYWNSGIFAWSAEVFLSVLKRHLPEMSDLLEEVDMDDQGGFSASSLHQFFDGAESISVDYGIMEKAENVMMIPFNVGWSDVGTWKGLKETADRFKINLPQRVRDCMKLAGF